MRDLQHSQTQRLYEFGIFRLDVEGQELLANGEPVRLTPKAFQTLLVLVERNGRVVSKEEFFEKIWADTFVEDSALSFNISQLRKILSQYDKEAKFIETVPRRGFRFVAEVREIEISTPQIVYEKRSIERILVEETIEINGEEENLIAPPRRAELPAKKSKRVYLFAAVGVVLLAAALAFGFFYPRQQPLEPISASAQINNVAVLPFQNLNESEQGKALSLGLTDALISRLGGLNRFAVRPLSAVQSFSQKEKDALRFGADLKVDAVLEGTLQTADNRLRVNLRLLKVADGSQIWSRSFDETETDIFRLQDAISTEVAESLNIQLSGREREQLAARPTENREAYEMYLRGRFHWNQRTAEGFGRALELFQQAVALDPRFAEAYVGIGNVHLGFYDYGLKSARETIPQAKNAINRALELNANSAEAYDLKGAVVFLHDRNAALAKSAFERAIELKPNEPTSHMRLGFMLTLTGDFAAANRELKIAEKLNPTSTIVQTNIGYLYFCWRRLDEAERQFKKVINDSPDFSLPHWYLSGIYHLQNKPEERMKSYIKALAADGEAELAQKIADAYETSGESAAIRVWRTELERKYRQTYLPPYNIALPAALEKDAEKTLYWLTEAEKQKDPWVLQFPYDPEFEFIRSDERFAEISRKLKLQL